jgi:hypothetical protein
MEKFEFYKNLYHSESSRRNELDNTINGPIGLITIIIGLIYFLVRNFKDEISIISGSFLILGTTLLFISLIFLAWSYNNLFKGFSYKYLPFSCELLEYQKEIENYNPYVEDSEKISFQKYLIDKFAELSSNNGKINQIRNLYLFRSKTFLLLAIFLVFSALVTVLLKIYFYE